VTSPLVERFASERLPGAELLGPVSGEGRWRSLAMDADVVVCVDAADPYDRRALVAAAAGAVPVGREDGPAAAVLGDDLLPLQSLESALDASAAREQRAARVADACSPERALERVGELLRARHALAA
jgi:hypothetical protein